ncbi:MAG TPA: hypothetical protein VFB25_09365 [Gaiellaceae bacterium]|nr:hypothetical protein [Gaiellaceae bacterium]
MEGSSSSNWPAGARMPIPGNAEWFWWIVASIVVAIVCLASSHADAGTWVGFETWVTAAYLISRGIAKASRVLEQ